MTETRGRTWLDRLRGRRARGDNSGGERRQLTVMFVDLVGSTAMAERHEPEQIRDLLQHYRERSGRVITEHHGHLAQYAGDGIMAYFGFPAAREDDARQAVIAGLELLTELEELDATIGREHGVELAARVGIHTGLVLVSDIASEVHTERDAVIGAAPNQAARIQTVAPDGSVAISDDTYEIVRGYFDVESLGTPPMKGIERPVEVFRVVSATGAVDRLHAAGVARSPFVGRRAERDHLHARWDALGTGQTTSIAPLVLVRGEAGIGKSRLVEEAVATAISSGGTVLSANCAPDRTASPFFPVAGLLERRFGLERTGDDTATFGRIEGSCAALGIEAPDTVGLVAGVLGITPPDRAGTSPRDPRVLRELTFAALVSVITAEAARAHTLLLVEDVQWADESTLELLARLVAVGPAAPLLVVATARPDFDAAPLGPPVDTIALGPLPDEDHRRLIEELARIHGVPEDLWGVIGARSDGNPLFAEELAKSIGRPADGPASSDQIPRTIRDLLTARLDALDRQKPLAQAAAVIGRDIDVDLLRTVTGLGRRQVTAELGELQRAGIVEPIPEGHPPVTHRFAHSLIRDAAYESQEQPRRREAHLAVAETLRARPGVDPGLVARHFDAARVPDEAVTWYLLAGASAQTSAADAEAIRLLDRGLELAATLPDDEARDTQEFNLRVVRGTSHVNTKGYGAPAAADDYGRSLELSERVGAVTDIVPATAAIWAYYLVHGDLASAAEAIVRLDEMRRTELEAEILCCEGVQRFFEGRIGDARTLLEASVQGFAERTPATQPSRRWLLPSDSVAVAMTHLGCVLWLVGEPAAAQEQLDAAATRARSLPTYPTGAFTQAYVASYAAWVEILSARFANGRALHEQATAIADRYGMLFWMAAGRSGDAIGCGYLGEPAAAIANLEPAMELWRSLGAEAFLPFVVTQRAQLHLMTNDADAALEDVDFALATAARTTEHFFTAEAHRIRAAILLTLDPSAVDAARAELDAARALAHEQGAIVFELRAAVDLVELDRADDDRRGAALDALRGALALVPAGGEFDDVDRARALLPS